jgi:hypothetical protein
MRQQTGRILSDPELVLSDPCGYPNWTPVTIRYRDLDPLKHINNSV